MNIAVFVLILIAHLSCSTARKNDLEVHFTFELPDVGPRQVNKPIVVAIDSRRIVSLDGVRDECSTQVNTWYSNSQVYVFDVETNTGKYVNVTGDIPEPAAFAVGFKSGQNKLMVMGGGQYDYFYGAQYFYVYNFSTIYELELEQDSGVWTSYTASGQIPSPRMEVSVFHEGDENLVYLYGGVAPSPTNVQDFLSFGEVFCFNITSKTFTMLKNGSSIDDGTDGIPKSRYHAHIFMTADGNELVISQGVHRISIFNSEDLEDEWRFNLITKTWRKVNPKHALPVQRRHGVELFISGERKTIGCLYSGDIDAPNRTTTPGCLFATVTDKLFYCNDFSAYGNKGNWFEVDVSGFPLASKYPGWAILNEKVYIFSGQDVDNNPDSVFYGQNFLTPIRIGDLQELYEYVD